MLLAETKKPARFNSPQALSHFNLALSFFIISGYIKGPLNFLKYKAALYFTKCQYSNILADLHLRDYFYVV